MRIAIDMQGALTRGSRPRGIGRYTSGLVGAMRELGGDASLILTLNDNHPEAARAIEADCAAEGARVKLTRYAVPHAESRAAPRDSGRRRVAEAIVRRHLAASAPDAVLMTSVFEQEEEDFSPIDLGGYPGRVRAAILYDLIPLVFADHYLSDPILRLRYHEMLDTLRTADLLLAISDSARSDAIRLLGIAPDRVVNISGAADALFRPIDVPPDRQASLREELNLVRPFVLYVAGADMRKNLEGALDAFAALPPAVRDAHQLLLVTPVDRPVAAGFRRRAGVLGLPRDGLVIVGDVPKDDLVALLNMAAALVFPSRYEGFGLPVLEAMQCGTPIVAADTSSIPELVDRTDLLFPSDDHAAAARILARILTDAGFRRDVAEWGPRRARRFTWRRSAEIALRAIADRVDLARGARPASFPCELLDVDGTRAEIADIVAEDPSCDREIEGFVEKLLFSVPQLAEGHARRLLIDVTDCRLNPAWTGIQRVVRKLTASFYAGAEALAVVPLAIRLDGPEPESTPDFVGAALGRAPGGRPCPVEIRPGDTLFMLDSNWTDYPSYVPLFGEVRRNGGRVVTCIYDIIPELHPEVCGEGMPEAHARWLHAAIRHSDGLLCISRAVADEVIAYRDRLGLPHRPGLKVGWFHCGSDIRDTSGQDDARAVVRDVFAAGRPTFLAIGTLEPRKAHALALDAFERLWARGQDVNLCFIGARGWKIDALEERIRGHAEHGRRLHWFSDAKDGDVAHAYMRAEAIVSMSMAEGFGLPLAEAARMGRPVICSDIPVFREVGGEGAVYFASGDAESLADTVEGWLGGRHVADPAKVSRSTWDDAARRIADILYRDEWYATIGEEPAEARP